jgi:hypothetical protein
MDPMVWTAFLHEVKFSRVAFIFQYTAQNLMYNIIVKQHGW